MLKSKKDLELFYLPFKFNFVNLLYIRTKGLTDPRYKVGILLKRLYSVGAQIIIAAHTMISDFMIVRHNFIKCINIFIWTKTRKIPYPDI